MNRRSFLEACGIVAAPLIVGRPRVAVGQAGRAAAAGRVRTLRSVAGVPPDIVGAFREPAAFQQAASGQYFVFDRTGHTVYGIDAAMTGSWVIVRIGGEAGRIIEPTAFAVAPNGTFVVADRPAALERVQLFGSGGALLGGFTLPGRASESVVIAGVVLNGVGSLHYSGRTIFINQPETGALVTEYAITGVALRSFGTLRTTGQEADRDVHLALNSGLPLVSPTGGFYFVFQTGAPRVTKFDDSGRRIFDRHIEGPELDDILNNLPTTWQRRKATGDRLLPVVPPVVRAAAVDATGHLWVAMTAVPYTYVYDPSGEKVRVVQFRAAGLVRPTGLFFSPDGRLLVTPGCYIFDPR
jgi:hypothetical protein